MDMTVRRVYSLPIAKVIYLVLPAGAHPRDFSWVMCARFREAFHLAFPKQDPAVLARKTLMVVQRLPKNLPPRTLVFRWHNPLFAGSAYHQQKPYEIGYFADRNDARWRSALVDKTGHFSDLDKGDMRFRFTWTPMGLPEAEDDDFAHATSLNTGQVVMRKKKGAWVAKKEEDAPHLVRFICERDAGREAVAA